MWGAGGADILSERRDSALCAPKLDECLSVARGKRSGPDSGCVTLVHAIAKWGNKSKWGIYVCGTLEQFM